MRTHNIRVHAAIRTLDLAAIVAQKKENCSMNLQSTGVAVVAAVILFMSSVDCQSYPRLEYWDQRDRVGSIENNSFINRASLQDGVLRCVTDNPTCCFSHWFDDNGQVVPSLSSGSSYATTEERMIDGLTDIGLVYRSGSNSSVGLFRCDTPNIHGVTNSLYVYVGTNTVGEGTFQSISISYDKHPRYEKWYQIPEFILTCRSQGGPATTVEWWRNDARVQEDSSHATSQMMVDAQNAVYLNRLTVWGREGGEYRCRVSSNIADYFIQLTYLSHMSASLRVKVAQKPRNVEHFRYSVTSLTIHWDTPSITPVGYIIYYNATDSGDIYEVSVNASNMPTQTFVLEGLSGDSYDISMLSLSQHLPSALVGSPITSVADLTPSVSVSTTTGDPEAGMSYTLTCTVTLIPGANVIPTIEWSGHSMDMAHVDTSGIISLGRAYTRELTFRPLVLGHGGEYMCTANFTINGVTSRDGVKAFILSVTIPEPSVLVSVTEGTVAYVGNNLTLECSIRLSPAISYSEVEVEVRWLKDGRVYGGQIGEAEISHGSTQSEISFTYLLESDSGWYDCEAILSPRDVRVNSPQLVTSTIYNLTAIVPSLIVQVSPSIVRILDVPPYNDFTLSCTIRAEVLGERVPLPLSIQWAKRSTEARTMLRKLSPSDYYLSGSPGNGYQSILTRSETDSESAISYRCRASFVSDINQATTFKFTDSQIAVVGPTTPVIPVSVRVTSSDNNSLSIQWEISSISYTPETYHVEYGTNRNQLDILSPSQESGPNIMIHGAVYSQVLSNLQPGTTYYYRVVSSNGAGSSASRVESVRAAELLKIQSSGVTVLGEVYTMSCIAAAESDQLTSLMWTNSASGDILNSSNHETVLELNFQSLVISDVGNYTCSGTFANGDSRELTEEVVAVVPAPNVHLEMLEHSVETLYAGLNLTLQCDVTLTEPSELYASVSIEWLVDGHSFRNCSQLQRLSDSNMHCLLDFAPLSYTRDNGSYSCRAILTPKPSYPFLRPQSVMSDALDISVAVPNVNVEISTSTTRLLDVAPYNQFSGSCSASVSVNGLTNDAIKLTRHWQWGRRREGETHFSQITSTAFIMSNTSISLIRNDEVISGSVTYQCVYSLEGLDDISSRDEVSVSVIGISAPSVPQNVEVSQISQDSAIIQWTVPSIAYTPETYTVEYGTASDSLGLSGDTVNTGADIKQVNKEYSVELKNLWPGTKYYYAVTAQNSARIIASAPSFFYTKERVPGKVSFVLASRVNDTSLNISWGEADPPNGNITSYTVWANSTSDNHTRHVPVSSPRKLTINGLTRKTVYKVYVAALNGAGHGEWEETINTVTTQGLLDHPGSDEGGVGEAVGATVAVFLLLIIIVAVVLLLVVCVRRRRWMGNGLILTREMRSSTLLNNIIKVEPKSVSRSPEPPQTNGGMAAAVAIAVGLEGDCGETKGGKDITKDSDDNVSKDSNNDDN